MRMSVVLNSTCEGTIVPSSLRCGEGYHDSKPNTVTFASRHNTHPALWSYCHFTRWAVPSGYGYE